MSFFKVQHADEGGFAVFEFLDHTGGGQTVLKVSENFATEAEAEEDCALREERAASRDAEASRDAIKKERNAAVLRKLDAYVAAAQALSIAWEGDLEVEYPEYLPSFDEHVASLVTWRDAVKKEMG